MILTPSYRLMPLLLLATIFGCSGPKLTTTPASWEEIENEINKHAGKIVVVDLWSNFCPPCMREFPNLVNLQSENRDHVKCISVNLNYTGAEDDSVEQQQAEADAFLNRINGTETNKVGLVKNFISKDSDETVLKKVNSYALPTVIIYDQHGAVAKTFPDDNSGEFTYEHDVLPHVNKLLANLIKQEQTEGPHDGQEK